MQYGQYVLSVFLDPARPHALDVAQGRERFDPVNHDARQLFVRKDQVRRNTLFFRPFRAPLAQFVEYRPVLVGQQFAPAFFLRPRRSALLGACRRAFIQCIAYESAPVRRAFVHKMPRFNGMHLLVRDEFPQGFVIESAQARRKRHRE